MQKATDIYYSWLVHEITRSILQRSSAPGALSTLRYLL